MSDAPGVCQAYYLTLDPGVPPSPRATPDPSPPRSPPAPTPALGARRRAAARDLPRPRDRAAGHGGGNARDAPVPRGIRRADAHLPPAHPAQPAAPLRPRHELPARDRAPWQRRERRHDAGHDGDERP